jgi:putative oxidoreductase
MLSLYDAATRRLNDADWLLASLARLVFAGVFLVYFWNSATTKLGGSIAGLFQPSFNAFAQIFPRAAEAVSYDITQASTLQKLVILAGTWAEFILPALIVLGLLTRLAALGMIGFVIVQSLTDVVGHGTPTGAWFDTLADGVILDQRALWLVLLLVLVFKGAGKLSLDQVMVQRRAA